MLRKRRDPSEIPAGCPAVSEGEPAILERLAVEAALWRTRPAHRTVLVLRFWEGLSYEEIAEVLGISLSAARMQETLRAFHEGELPDAGQRAVTAHLERCPACQEALLRLEETDRLLRATRPNAEPLSPGEARGIFRRALAGSGVLSRGRGAGRRLGWALAAMALALFAAGAVVLPNRISRRPGAARLVSRTVTQSPSERSGRHRPLCRPASRPCPGSGAGLWRVH